MRTFVFLAAAALAAASFGAEPAVTDLVRRLKASDASYDDWPPIIQAGPAAIPELKKLLGDPNEEARAAAAVILYRLGEASALNVLDTLLEAKSAAARKEAAEALAAFTGGPAGSGEALPAWRTWWKANREKALAAKPLTTLHGKVTGCDPASSLVATSLASRHGARPGMRFNVRRGSDFVCVLDLVFASPEGSVGRIAALSSRTEPKAGDLCFWAKPQGD